MSNEDNLYLCQMLFSDSGEHFEIKFEGNNIHFKSEYYGIDKTITKDEYIKAHFKYEYNLDI